MLKWFNGPGSSWQGFEDGAIWAWVELKGDSWSWSTDCTEDGTDKEVSGFATAEEAKSAADTAYGEWVESLGDLFKDMPALDMDFIQNLTSEYDEDEILSVFNVPEDDE